MTTSKLITKRDLRKVFFRSFPMEWTWNYEKQQNLGYTYAMIPIIEKLYKDKPEEKAAALQRHLEFFNTLKANGELNEKYPNGIEAQKEKLEAEGHTIVQKGRKNIRYYVKDYEKVLFDLK